MDLETIGKKMIEALVVRGQIAKGEGELSDINIKRAIADSEIQSAVRDKDGIVLKKKQAKTELDKAEDNVALAQAELKTAETNLYNATFKKDARKVAYDKYDDTILGGLDSVIAEKESKRNTIAVELNDKTSKLDEMKRDLKARQGELKIEGIELDTNPPRPPKVTYL